MAIADVLAIAIPLATAVIAGLFTLASGAGASPASSARRRREIVNQLRDDSTATDRALTRVKPRQSGSGDDLVLAVSSFWPASDPSGKLSRGETASIAVIILYPLAIVGVAYVEFVLRWGPYSLPVGVILPYLGEVALVELWSMYTSTTETPSNEKEDPVHILATGTQIVSSAVVGWCLFVVATFATFWNPIATAWSSSTWPLLFFDFGFYALMTYVIVQVAVLARHILEGKAYQVGVVFSDRPVVRVVVYQGWGRVSEELEGKVTELGRDLVLERSDGFIERIGWGDIGRFAVKRPT